jgi:hypothetical protein
MYLLVVQWSYDGDAEFVKCETLQELADAYKERQNNGVVEMYMCQLLDHVVRDPKTGEEVRVE